MTTIHMLGSDGFIGRAIQRESREVDLRCWSHKNRLGGLHFDLLNKATWDALLEQRPANVMLLSWPGLPNYNDSFHLTRNLPACIDLIENLIETGLRKIVVMGTCYEYGLQNGELRESQPTNPLNCYSIAKDSLCRYISNRLSHEDIQWSWLRVFYPYGEEQNPNSLLPSLDRAIEEGKTTFKIGSGRQIRDYLPVELVARHALAISTSASAHGIYNSCSGAPKSIREIVENRIKERGADITLELAIIPDRSDEPIAFWGCPRRINEVMNDAGREMN
jgi:dTDP-6-deoxy-L-talose 4-dehydrogenase (NAD+)